MDFGNECHHEIPMASRSSVVICPGSRPGNHSSAVSIKGPEHPSSHLHPNSPPLRRSHRLCSQVPFWREARGRKGGNPEDGEFIPKRLDHLKRGQTGRQLWFHKLIYWKFVFLSPATQGGEPLQGRSRSCRIKTWQVLRISRSVGNMWPWYAPLPFLQVSLPVPSKSKINECYCH